MGEFEIQKKVGKMQDERDRIEEELNAVKLLESKGFALFVTQNNEYYDVFNYKESLKNLISEYTQKIHAELNKLPRIKTIKSYKLVEVSHDV